MKVCPSDTVLIWLLSMSKIVAAKVRRKAFVSSEFCGLSSVELDVQDSLLV